MIAGLRNVVCRGGIWYFGKHKVKPKEVHRFFSPEFPTRFYMGNGIIDLGGHQAI